MKLLFVGITNHHHIQNFSKSIKKNLGYEIYAINTNPNYINNKGEEGLFFKEYTVRRFKSRIRDFFSKVFSPIKIMFSLKEHIDIVQFHLVSLYTLPLAIIAKAKGMNVSCFVWGSEFLRANWPMKCYFFFVFMISDSVVCDSAALCDKLCKAYALIKKRFCCVQFGSSVIDNLLESEMPIVKKENERICVMCGYNGSEDQKHIKIMEVLQPLHNNLSLIIPMTYACGDDYRNMVRKSAEDNKFEYEVLDHFIEGEEWENYLRKTDIFIHMQSSDSFSSSVAEHLLLKHIVINADWLVYDDLDYEKVFYIRANFDNLLEKVQDAIKNRNEYIKKCEYNQERIIKLKSLNYCVNNYWKPYFESLQLA